MAFTNSRLEEERKPSRSYANRLQEMQNSGTPSSKVPEPVSPDPAIVIPRVKEQRSELNDSFATTPVKSNVNSSRYQSSGKIQNLEKRLALQREKYKLLEEKNKQLQARIDVAQQNYEDKIEKLTQELNSLKRKGVPSGSMSMSEDVLEELQFIKHKVSNIEKITLDIQNSEN